MTVVKMTSQGRITLPRQMREDLDLIAGSKVSFVKIGEGEYRVVPGVAQPEGQGGTT